MVNFCQSCGAKITDESCIFCNNCGAKLLEIPSDGKTPNIRPVLVQPKSSGIFKHICPYCKVDVDPTNQKICHNCGKPLTPQWGKVLICLIGLIICLYLLWWWASNNLKFF